MATFTTTVQGTSPTTVGATDIIQFAGGAFNGAIVVNQYNDSTHVKSSGGSDLSASNTPKNNKFISQTGGSGGKSQVDVGGGTVNLDTVTTTNCVLKINFSHGSSVATSGASIYAYDGTTPATAPSNVDVRLAEQGDTNFTEAEGSAAALALDNQVAATSHDYFIIGSMSPSSVGAKSGNKLRITLIYT